MRRFSRTAPAVLALIAAITVAGCFNPFRPLVSSQRGVSEPPPIPDSERNVLELFRWCWENRAIEEYRNIFTDDYTFQFSQQDSAGQAFRDRPWTREDEMISATNLFVGGNASEPPADRITLDFTNTLRVFNDSRPGKNPKWHKEIPVEVNLRVKRGESTLEVRGPGTFFVVRGDSAAIPEELSARGVKPDSTVWYIERWEDETVADQTGAYGARPAHGAAALEPQPFNVSIRWGALKAGYRGDPLAP